MSAEETDGAGTARSGRALTWVLSLHVALSSAGMVGSYVLAIRGVVPLATPVYFAFAGGVALLIAYWLAARSQTATEAFAVPTTVWASIITSHILLVFLPPLLSDDVWRYLFDGLLQRHGLHPWAYAPSSAKVADIAAQLPAPVNQGHLRSLYPPFAEWLFAANAFLGGSLALWKSAMLTCALMTTELVRRRFGEIRALVFLGHPLTMLAVSSEGHVDSTGILLLFAAVALPLALWKRAVLFSAAIATKLIPLLALPALLAHHRARWLQALGLVAATFALISVPYVSAGADSLQTLGTYLGSWSFNGSVAPVAIHALEAVIAAFAGETTFELSPLTAVNRWLGQSTVYDGQATFGSWWSPSQLAEAVYRALSLIGLGALALYAAAQVASSRWTLQKSTLLILLGWLLLSPVVHPWYVLWALPLSFGSGRVGIFAQAWSVIVLVSYLTPARYLAFGQWTQAPGKQLIQYGALTLVTVVLWWHGPIDATKRRTGQQASS